MQTIFTQTANSQLSPPYLSTAERLMESNQANDSVREALKTREALASFVGETFFHQMIKAMRTSVGKPAYFHGGQAEEIFRSQLDQTLAEKMAADGAEDFTRPMFERQFPQLANLLREHEDREAERTGVANLPALNRR